MRIIIRFLLLTIFLIGWIPEGEASEIPRARFIAAQPMVFNPSNGEETVILFTIFKEAQVTVRIYDSLDRLVRTLCINKVFQAGECEVKWDGRDEEGKIVPDEAYIFTIHTRAGPNYFVYDPADRSRGSGVKVSGIKYDPKRKKIMYKLSHPARAGIRIGLKEGPLLHTVADWEPRRAGLNEEDWNGLDEVGLLRIYEHPQMDFFTAAFTLPENSIITQGNSSDSRFIEGSLPEKRSKKPRPPTLHAYARRNLLHLHAPRFDLASPRARLDPENNRLIVSGKVPIRVTIRPEDRAWLINNRFEVIVFIDYIFLFEEEEGFSPFTFYWDTRGVSKGPHVLTVNLIDGTGNVGTRSLLLQVE
jgi:FlgD Ig-like domain